MGTAASRRVPRTAEETDPRLWWVAAEAGCCFRTIEPRKGHGGQGPGRDSLARRAPKGRKFVRR